MASSTRPLPAVAQLARSRGDDDVLSAPARRDLPAVLIGELSRRTGVSTRMLRYYEEKGLLEPNRRPNGYRVYGETDVDRVRFLRAMFGRGLSAQMISNSPQLLHRLEQSPDISDPLRVG